MADLVYMTKTAWTALLNAIRTKGGTSAPMTAAQAKTAVEAIDGYGKEDFGTHANLAGVLNYAGTWMLPYSYAKSGLTEVHAPNLTRFSHEGPNTDGSGARVFMGCTSLTTAEMPNLETPGSGGYQFEGCTALESIYLPKSIAGTYMFYGCSSLETAVIGVKMATAAQMNGYAFSGGCTKLHSVDLLTSRVYSYEFYNASKLKTLVIRNTDAVPALYNINAFHGTPFASGGSGGTLYVPQALIASYQAATNWSTILGYADNQILPIEGSAYETEYVDGTAI